MRLLHYARGILSSYNPSKPMPLLAPLTQLPWPATPQRCGRTSREPVQREPVEATARHGVKACNDVSPGGPTSARDIAARLAALLAFALVGCATPVMQPSVDVPGRFAGAPASDSEPEVAWWDSYGDPVLSDLVGRAARENRDVKIAAERVRAARSGETISRSWLYPSVGIQGAGFDHRTGYDSATKQFVSEAADTKGWQGGVDVSWEVDIAGRLRAGAAAAAADTRAAEHIASGVRLLVVSDVATNYFTLVGALRQLDTVRAISAAQDETLRLVTARQRVGLATLFDVERAQTEASKARGGQMQVLVSRVHSDNRVQEGQTHLDGHPAVSTEVRPAARFGDRRRDGRCACKGARALCSFDRNRGGHHLQTDTLREWQACRHVPVPCVRLFPASSNRSETKAAGVGNYAISVSGDTGTSLAELTRNGILPCQQRCRHAHDSSLSRPPQHHAHCALYPAC